MKKIKIIMIALIMCFALSVSSQNSATFKSNVGACIVDINIVTQTDTESPIIKIDMTYRYVVDNFNRPNKIVNMENKVKFIYDDCYVYFNKGVVDLIQKRKCDKN